MYYQNYEDYMRAVLGYPIERRENYIPIEQSYNFESRLTNTKELEECYPEVYRIINPIVCEICNKYNGNYTKDTINIMVDEVYKRISLNNEISIKINLDNKTQEKEIHRNNLKTGINNRILDDNIRKNVENENNRQIRPNNNPFLNDLIRILILNQILNGGGFFPERPPRPRPPVRSPMPPDRPPFHNRPRQLITEERMYNDYFDI